jgi:spermidine synthase
MISNPERPPVRQITVPVAISPIARLKSFLGPAEPLVIKNSRETWILFLASVLGLFLELMLIRWIGTEIRIFAYLQNTILVVCFMGLGIGCLTCRKPIVMRDLLLPLIVLVMLMAIPLGRDMLRTITGTLSVLDGLLIWESGETISQTRSLLSVAIGLSMAFLLLVFVWDIFVPIGRLTGRLIDGHPRTIWAYSINVAGGLLGIWLFVALGALGQPPVVWFGVAAVLLIGLIGACSIGSGRWHDLVLTVGIVVLAWFAGRESDAVEVRWSPYQKLVLRAGDAGHTELGKYQVLVNNAGYQAMLDLDERHVASDPEHYPPAMRGLSQYDIPFLLHANARKALLVGAGTGNDAAGALRHGVEQVTAVEIDPEIIDLGRRYHPEKPYDSSRVTLVNDDARSYFATCKDRYDVIVFGLLDSHTTTAMTNARLDHYVYTKESLQHARSLLADGGVMVLSFEAQKPYIADRMAGVLREVFGSEPICFRVPSSNYGWGGVIFVEGDVADVAKQIANHPGLAAQIEGWNKNHPVSLTGTTRITTDDWPYLYLESARIPSLYYLLGGLLFVLMLRGVGRSQIRDLVLGWDKTHWHFFFLGAAFLLLEVQNVSKASAILGNTWLVNAVIISAVLAMVLLANLIVSRFPGLPSWLSYAGVCGTCLALYFVDISRFAFLPYATKAAIVGCLTSLPMLFSGIIFIRSFTAVARKDRALGANLIGALAGGLLQSVTFVTGIRALLLIVAALYVAAILSRPRAPIGEE